MYSIGVQPPSATLLNRKPYENAHTSLSSMYSGLPDIPCQNPDTAILGSSDLTRMMSCFGRKFFTTETTSKVKRSGLVPAKVVKPYPVCPRCTLDTGKISAGCAYAMVAYASTPTAAQCRTNPRMCNEHSGPVQVPPQPTPGRRRIAATGTRPVSRPGRAG